MKKTLLLTAFIAIFSLSASAQIKKGSIYLGGDISANSQKRDFGTSQPDFKNKYANFNISAGSFVKQNLVAGVYGGYGHGEFNNAYPGGSNFRDSKYDSYRFGLFARQYKKLAKDFYFFGELGTGYFGSNQTDVDMPVNFTTKYKGDGAEFYLAAGASYRVYKKLYVELSIPRVVNLQYAVKKETSPGQTIKENQLNLSTNLTSSIFNSLGLGFRFIL